ncbi:hypothetical protein Q4Q66_16495, partial [Morganella morganii]
LISCTYTLLSAASGSVPGTDYSGFYRLVTPGKAVTDDSMPKNFRNGDKVALKAELCTELN